MYELKQVGARTYYINCPAKIGIYLTNDRDVYLIDSGSDKDAGKKVRKILDEHAWVLKAIVNTHSHADHIGGNRYLQQQYGCKAFAPGIEAAFTNYPILESSFLYGGYPCTDLRHKFLLAQESDAADISDKDFPAELQVISLKGHSFDMVGVRTPDNAVFLADCVSSRVTLEKYRIPFIYDVRAYLETLDAVEKLDGAVFIPAHAEVTDDVRELVRFNRENVFETAGMIEKLLETPMCFEALLKKLFDVYELAMSFEQYVLVGSTVRSYLAWMKDCGKLRAEFADNLLLWSAG